MKKLLIGLIVFIGLMGLVLAADWTPQGDINLRNTYKIINATNISAAYYCDLGEANCYTLTELIAGSDYYAGGVYIYLNGSNYFIFNETKLIVTGDARWNNTQWVLDQSYLTSETDPIFTAWDNFTGIPTATPSNGDTTHLSTADQIYDWVISLAYATQSWVTTQLTSYVAIADLVSYVGNWSADKPDYSTTAESITYFVNRSDWTTIDDFPSACSAGDYVYQIGDSLSCSTPSYIGNCSGDGDCSNIIYQSELPLANETLPHCSNVTGATSDLCTIVNTDTYVVSSECSSGDFIYNITGDTIYCATPAGGGDITGVLAGTGLIGGGATGEVTLNVSAATCGVGEVSKYNGTGFTCEIDAGTSYTNGSGISIVGTEINHSDTSSQASDENSGNTFIQDVVLDQFGHVTSLVSAAVSFASYWDTSNDLDTVIDADEISEGKIEFTTACASGNHYYLSGNDLACEADDDTTYSAGNGISLAGTTFSVAGNTALSQDADGLSVTADGIGDTQLAFNTGQALTTASSPTFAGVTIDHFKIDTTNITCLDSACNWYSNATDSCMYWPSGGKDCGAA